MIVSVIIAIIIDEGNRETVLISTTKGIVVNSSCINIKRLVKNPTLKAECRIDIKIDNKINRESVYFATLKDDIVIRNCYNYKKSGKFYGCGYSLEK